MAPLRAAAVLAAAMALALGLITTLYALLSDDIHANQRDYETAQLYALLTVVAPAASLPPPLSLTTSLPTSDLQQIYLLYQDDQLSALLLQARARGGYNDDISLLIAHRRGDKRAILRVLQHRETPGIADFLNTAPEKAYDGVSGATISANAIRQTAAEVQTWVNGCIRWAVSAKEPPLAPGCY